MSVIEINWNPGRRQLRSFGIICLVAFGAIGAWVYFRHSIFGFGMAGPTASTTAYVLWGVAVLCAALAGAAPPALRPLYVALSAITLPIGFVVSHVVLALLFYIVLTPIGLVMRLTGWDPLSRRFDPGADSYWTRREAVTDVKRYYRQF
jgi:hypothetical protein